MSFSRAMVLFKSFIAGDEVVSANATGKVSELHNGGEKYYVDEHHLHIFT